MQPQGLSYKAHWEALGCALCLLTAPKISGTGPVRGRGFCPGSLRPRARVLIVVWAWDFCMWVFHRGLPGPALHCFSICDFENECFSHFLLVFFLSESLRASIQAYGTCLLRNTGLPLCILATCGIPAAHASRGITWATTPVSVTNANLSTTLC